LLSGSWHTGQAAHWVEVVFQAINWDAVRFDPNGFGVEFESIGESIVGDRLPCVLESSIISAWHPDPFPTKLIDEAPTPRPNMRDG
jgi:hypothetical protein